MRRWLLTGLLVLLAFPLRGQEYVHRDYYGQGDSYPSALDALVRQVGQAVPFENASLAETYRTGISRAAVEQKLEGRSILSLGGKDLDALFRARQARAAGILDEGRRAQDEAVRKTYYTWAWYYLASLPSGYQLPEKQAVKQWLSDHESLAPARLPVAMTHIEREVAAIRSVLAESPALPRETRSRTTAEPPAPVEEPLPERKELEAVPEAPGFQGYVENRTGEVPAFPAARRTEAVRTEVPPLRTRVLLTRSLAPEWVPGLLLNVQGKWGGVLAAGTNFQSRKGQYEALSSGFRTDGDGFIWPDGDTCLSHFSMSAGVSCAVFEFMSPYVTAGYGHRTVYWKDTDGQWARIRDLSAEGLSLSAGVFFGWKHFCAGVSLSSVAFRTMGLSVGAGLQF